MRDLFQVVFELKKKEIEDAKTMLENKEQQQQVQKSKVRFLIQFSDWIMSVIIPITGISNINYLKLFQENLLLPPHHPSNVGGATQQHSAASFPDGSPLHPQSMQKMQGAAAVGASLGGGTSGALTDLLGLESECANIQAGIRQIDQIGSNPVAMAALQNPGISGFNSGAEMIPIGSLQPSSNHFPVGSQQQMGTSSLQVSNTSGQHKPHHPQAIMNSGGVTSKQDLFGATPFLPPPPSKV